MNHRAPLRTIIAAVAFALAAAPAFADTALSVDPAHTAANFSIRHLSISNVQGSIPMKSAKLIVGAGNIPVSAEAEFDLSGIDTKNGQRDSDLKSDHWFDVAKYPTMTFKTTKVTPGTGGAFTMVGDLTLHGVTNSVTLSGKVEGNAMLQGKTHVGFSATGVVDRTRWNLGQAPAAIVGNEATLTIELEGIAPSS